MLRIRFPCFPSLLLVLVPCSLQKKINPKEWVVKCRKKRGEIATIFLVRRHATLENRHWQVESTGLATRLSIAPWHLRILSGLMRLFDIFAQEQDPLQEDKA